MRFVNALFIAYFVAALHGQQSKYKMTGQVIFDDGAPVVKAVVTVSDTDWREAGEPVLTDSQGRFEITGLGEGNYIVTAQRNDLGSFTLGESPRRDSVSAFAVNQKFPSEKIVFRIIRPATITGTVRDSTGNPVALHSITAARRSWGDGKVVTLVSGSAVTDDAGNFRLPLLHPGRYRVCVERAQEHAVLPIGYAVYGQRSSDSYSRSCVPDAHKAFIVVGPGAKVDADIALGQQTDVEVSGTVVNLPEEQQALVQLKAADSSDQRMQVGIQTSGPAHYFKLMSVSPGQYWLSVEAPSVSAPGTSLSARIPLTVGASGLSGIELRVAPRPVIDVVVHAPNGAGDTTIGLRDADQSINGLTNAARQADGSLRIALPHAGRYWLVTRGQECPLSARFGKSDAMKEPLKILSEATGTLDVTITSECGAIEGVAINRSGTPVPFARALILMSGTPDDPGDLMTATTDDDGKFNYNGLTPGKYYLWTWEQAAEWNGEVGDLVTMQAHQTVVEIKARDKTNVNVPIVNFEAQGIR